MRISCESPNNTRTRSLLLSCAAHAVLRGAWCRDSRVRAKSEAQRRSELEQMVQALQAQVNNLTAEADQVSAPLCRQQEAPLLVLLLSQRCLALRTAAPLPQPSLVFLPCFLAAMAGCMPSKSLARTALSDRLCRWSVFLYKNANHRKGRSQQQLKGAQPAPSPALQASMLKQQLLSVQEELLRVREENEQLARQRQQMKDQLQVASRLRGSNLHPAAMQQQLQRQEALLQSYPTPGVVGGGLLLGASSMSGNPMHGYPPPQQAEMGLSHPGAQLRGLGTVDMYGTAGRQQQQQQGGQQARQREEEGLWQGCEGGEEDVNFVPPSPRPVPAAVHMAGAYPMPFEDESCLHRTISPPSAPHATMSQMDRLDSAWGAAGIRRCANSSRSAAAPAAAGVAAAAAAAAPAMAAPAAASGRLPPQHGPPSAAHGYPPPAPAAQLAGSVAASMPTPPLGGSVAVSMHGGQRQTAADMLPRGLLDSMQVPPSAVPSGATLSDYGSGGSAHWANPNYSGPSSSSFSDPATELWHSMQPPHHHLQQQQQQQPAYAQQQQAPQQQRYPHPSTAPPHRHQHHRRQPSAPPGSAPAATPLAGQWGHNEGPLTAMYSLEEPGVSACLVIAQVRMSSHAIVGDCKGDCSTGTRGPAERRHLCTALGPALRCIRSVGQQLLSCCAVHAVLPVCHQLGAMSCKPAGLGRGLVGQLAGLLAGGNSFLSLPPFVSLHSFAKQAPFTSPSACAAGPATQGVDLGPVHHASWAGPAAPAATGGGQQHVQAAVHRGAADAHAVAAVNVRHHVRAGTVRGGNPVASAGVWRSGGASRRGGWVVPQGKQLPKVAYQPDIALHPIIFLVVFNHFVGGHSAAPRYRLLCR